MESGLLELAIAPPAYFACNACIISTQYTIRAIPPVIDHALRHRATVETKSLNAVVVDAPARGLELEAKPVNHSDPDDLIGSWEDDPAFDAAVSDFAQVDEEAWK